MSLLLAKKKDKAVQKKVQSLLRSKANKKCFDCPAKNPTFVNTNLQTFVCSRCACLVREIGFRARLASSGKFTGAEVVELQYGGNEVARKIWLSSYVVDQEEPNEDDQVRNFMAKKYLEKKWLDNVLFENHQQKLKDRVSKSYTEDGLPIETKYRSKVDGGFSRLRLIDDDEDNQDFEIYNQIEEEVIEDLTPEATKSSGSTSSASKFTLNPSKFFSGFSLTKRSSSKNKKQEEENNTPPTSPVSMTVTSTEENENIDFVSPLPSPSNSTNSFSSVQFNRQLEQHEPVTSPSTIIPVSKPVIMMGSPPPPTANAPATITIATIPTTPTTPTNPTTPTDTPTATTTLLTTIEKEEPQMVVADAAKPMDTIFNTDFIVTANNRSTKDYNQQQQARRSEEIPQNKVNYSNIIQPVPPAKCARFSAPPTVARTNNNIFSDIMSELSGLQLEKSFGNIAYSGSVLSPTNAYQPMKAMKPVVKEEVKQESSLFDFSSQFRKQQQQPAETKYDDIYQAIRSIPQTTVAHPQLTTHVMNQESSSEDEDEDDPWQEFCSSSSVNDEPWQEFCSASSVDENSVDEDISIGAEVNKIGLEKPNPFPVVVNLFEDLDPFAVSRRF